MAMEKRARFRSWWLPYALILPQIALTLVFFVWPAGQAVYQSLYIQDAFGGNLQFVGLDNFAQLAANPLFPIAVVNTVVWTVMALVVIIPISLLLAQCLVIVGRGRNVYQAFIFLPVVVSLVAIALRWKFA